MSIFLYLLFHVNFFVFIFELIFFMLIFFSHLFIYKFFGTIIYKEKKNHNFNFSRETNPTDLLTLPVLLHSRRTVGFVWRKEDR